MALLVGDTGVAPQDLERAILLVREASVTDEEKKNVPLLGLQARAMCLLAR